MRARFRHWWAATLGTLAVLGMFGSASAAELLLAQPSVCPIGDELAFRVQRALGRPLAAAAEVRFTVHIERARGAFSARLELGSPTSREPPRQRSFHALSCEKLVDTLSLAVVLALTSAADAASADVTRGSALPATLPGSESLAGAARVGAVTGALRANGTDTAGRSPELDDGNALVSQERTSSGLRGALRGAVVADAGTLPSGLGAVLGASLGGQFLEARVLGTYLPARHVSVAGSELGPAGVKLALAAASLLGCAPRLIESGVFELGACAGTELGWLWGKGTGVTVSRRDGALWSAARADLVTRWSLGPRWLALEGQLGVLVPLGRSQFTLYQEGNLLPGYRPAVIAGRLSAGISIEWDRAR